MFGADQNGEFHVMKEGVILIHYMAIFVVDQSLPDDWHTDQLIHTMDGSNRQSQISL